MPHFTLDRNRIAFPPADFADVDGFLASGGAVSADWLIAAYRNGTFLWSPPMAPLQWWSPNPRIVLFAEKLHEPQEVCTVRNRYRVSFNNDLDGVMHLCKRIYNQGDLHPQWISGMLMRAYRELAERGIAFSAEVRRGQELVGGTFGAVLGGVFFGEYVCGIDEWIAELALVEAVKHLSGRGVRLFDLHKETMTTDDIGYEEIPRQEFLRLIRELTSTST